MPVVPVRDSEQLVQVRVTVDSTYDLYYVTVVTYRFLQSFQGSGWCPNPIYEVANTKREGLLTCHQETPRRWPVDGTADAMTASYGSIAHAPAVRVSPVVAMRARAAAAVVGMCAAIVLVLTASRSSSRQSELFYERYVVVQCEALSSSF